MWMICCIRTSQSREATAHRGVMRRRGQDSWVRVNQGGPIRILTESTHIWQALQAQRRQTGRCRWSMRPVWNRWSLSTSQSSNTSMTLSQKSIHSFRLNQVYIMRSSWRIKACFKINTVKWTFQISIFRMSTKWIKICRASTTRSKTCLSSLKRTATQGHLQSAAVWIWVKSSMPRSEKSPFQETPKRVYEQEMLLTTSSDIITHRTAPWDLWPKAHRETCMTAYVQIQATTSSINTVNICQCWKPKTKCNSNSDTEFHQINQNSPNPAPQSKRSQQRTWLWLPWKATKAPNTNELTPGRYWKQSQPPNRRKQEGWTMTRDQTEARPANSQRRCLTIGQSRSQRLSQLRRSHISTTKASIRRVIP